MLDDGTASATSREQWSLELRVLKIYRCLDAMMMENNYNALTLNKGGHALFLKKGLGPLMKGKQSPVWLVYVHG